MKRLLPLVLLLTACAPALPAEIGYAAYIAQMTGTSNAAIAQSTQAIATQSADEYQYAKLKTEQARPAMETGTAIAISTQQIGLDLAKTRAAYEALGYASAFTSTMEAGKVLSSDTQRRIAENNRAIADSVHGGELRRSTTGFLVGLGVFGFGVVVAWLVFQVCIHIHNRRKIADKGAAWTEIFKQEKAMRALGVAQTSAGPTSYNAVTLAEKHLEKFNHAKTWRTACNKLVEHGVIAGQGGGEASL